MAFGAARSPHSEPSAGACQSATVWPLESPELSEGEGDRRDALIVAANDAGWSALARSLAERAVTPTHSFPPRCVIVAVRPPDVDALRRVPGVRVVVDVLPGVRARQPAGELASQPRRGTSASGRAQARHV